MKIQIKHRWSHEVIFECEADNIIMAVKLAIESGANLRWANLYGADLSEAELSNANLIGADLGEANLSEANLREANLYEADLRDADLRGADLRGADLRGADLRGAGLIVIQLPFYTAYVQKTHTRIGCKYHSNDEWKSFTDEEISKMDSNALEFWSKCKAVIFASMDSLQGGDE